MNGNDVVDLLEFLIEIRGGKIDESRLEEQKKIIHKIKESIDKGFQLILEAPTGFGKTECAFTAFLDAYSKNIVERFIHVVPTRSLLRALFRRYLTYSMKMNSKILVSYDHGDLWFRRPHIWDNIIEKGITFENIEKYKEQIFKDIASAINRGDYEELRKLLGHSYFIFPITVSTLDVFAYAFLSKRTYQDYLLMPINLMSYSLIVLDEVHVLQDIDYYTLDVVKNVMHDFANASIPSVLMSATLPTSLINELESIDSVKHIVVQWRGTPIDVVASPLQKGKHLTLDEVLRIINENKYKDILIVVNTVSFAQSIYGYLKQQLGKREEYIIRLVHGMFCDHDRFIREVELEDLAEYKRRNKKGKSLILISTQVAECGLDYPFDIVLSELAPIDALIQRIGRIRGKGTAIIYDVETPHPYEKEVLKPTKNAILNNVNLLGEAPRSINSARELLDIVYNANVIGRLKEKSLFRREYLYRSFYDYFEALNVLRNPELEIRIRPNTYIEAVIISDECYDKILKDITQGINRIRKGDICYHKIRTRIENGYTLKLQLSRRYFTFDENVKRFKPGGLIGNTLRAYNSTALELRIHDKFIEIIPTEILHPYNLYLIRESLYSSEVGLRRFNRK